MHFYTFAFQIKNIMKKIVLAIAVIATAASFSAFTPAAKPPVSYGVDTTKSKIVWNGSVADHYHVGVIKIKTGQLALDNGKISGGQFTFDANSIASLAASILSAAFA